nr:MAG TPA: hypothetical protein [Caudoviricetes sp.]DAZ70894.1 MAG TPA: hypothetical protein [Caudoviricetes sp.]
MSVNHSACYTGLYVSLRTIPYISNFFGCKINQKITSF